MPSFRQRDQTDCGAACLAYVFHRHRRPVPAARIRQLAGTGPSGTTALGLAEAARQLGFGAKGVRGGPESLGSVPLPAIAHCRMDRGTMHFVVLVRWDRQSTRVMDPAVGREETWSRERFTTAWTGVLVLISPTVNSTIASGARSPWQRLWELLPPHRPLLIQAFCGAAVTTILGLSTSIFVEQIVDRVIPDGNRELLLVLGLGMTIVLALRLILGWFQSILSLQVAQRIDLTIMQAYYRHLLRLPQSFFDTMRVGEITSRVTDAIRIRQFLNQSLLSLGLHPLVLIFSLTALFLYSAKLAALSLLLLPAHVAIYWLSDLRNRRWQRRVMERSADFGAHLTESLSVHRTVRALGLAFEHAARMEYHLVRLLKATWQASRLGVFTGSAATLLTQGYLIALLWLGAQLALQAEISPGQLMSCYALATFLTPAVASLITLNGSVREALIATERLFEILDLETESDEGLVPQIGARHEFRFEQVSFRHPGRPAAIRDLSLEIRPSAITALTGPSGCGKSTVLGLLQRLYEPTEGRIVMGDLDLRQFQLARYRKQISVVAQRAQLFSGTILENLSPGFETPEVERLLDLCRELGALEFVEKLPRGLLTHLPEGGANLSGGQRQRLALVRAFYRNAPLALLDEPDSNLDEPTLRLLIRYLQRRRDETGLTVVVATHCAELVAAADRVYALPGPERRVPSSRAASGP